MDIDGWMILITGIGIIGMLERILSMLRKIEQGHRARHHQLMHQVRDLETDHFSFDYHQPL